VERMMIRKEKRALRDKNFGANVTKYEHPEPREGIKENLHKRGKRGKPHERIVSKVIYISFKTEA
jgi:hypothetical protein